MSKYTYSSCVWEQKGDVQTLWIMNMSLRMGKAAYAKTKTQISFAVTAKLISAFVFATRIVQFFSFLNPKFQASSLLLWMYRLAFVRLGRKPKLLVFSRTGSYNDPFPSQIRPFSSLVMTCGCKDRHVSHLVRDPNNCFSCYAAQTVI